MQLIYDVFAIYDVKLKRLGLNYTNIIHQFKSGKTIILLLFF